MSNEVFVGIDFGELELRVAYTDAGKPVFLHVDPIENEPSLLFDPSRNVSSLGVGFPSVLQSVGAGVPFLFSGRHETSELVVQRRLTSICERVRAQDATAAARAVLAVPTALSQRKRQTLVHCAKQAGFAEVSLIDRAIAVALGVRTDRDQSATFVVFNLDYGACEYSLARLSRGRCWILGSALEQRVSGERLDALIMEDIILGLRDRQVFLGLRRFTSEQWHKFRRLAESIRYRLATEPAAEIQMNQELTGTPNVMVVRLDAARFAETLKQQLAEALDNIGALLEQNQLESTNVDAVLLVGDVATTHPVDNIVWEAYPNRVARTDPNVIALGALIAAADSANVTLPQSNRAGFEISADLHGPPRVPASSRTNGNAQFSEVTAIEGLVQKTPGTPPEPPRPPASSERFSEVRALMAQARYREAEQLVATMSRELEELRVELKSLTPTRPQQLLQQAQALVVDGRFSEAVQLAHQAYATAPHDAIVFSGMMKIHADAGLGLNRPDEYEDAVHILTCAYGHDQTDRAIHKALAERHYLHARAMQRLNNFDRSLEAAKQALMFEPRHVDTKELVAELLKPEERGHEPVS
ncbi:MAG TPA: Hsp70 family protein [Thermoanaerobaculia bacterium]|nr:Hsp70 family protein [Thermoanaerobaculia bacterium]